MRSWARPDEAAVVFTGHPKETQASLLWGLPGEKTPEHRPDSLCPGCAGGIRGGLA